MAGPQGQQPSDLPYALPPPPPPPPIRPSPGPGWDGLWSYFRQLRLWVQLLIGATFLPLVLAVATLARPKTSRRVWWAATAIATVLYGVAFASPNDTGDHTEVAAVQPIASPTSDAPTTTAERQHSSTTHRPTTTTLPDAPEGGQRSGTGDDLPQSASARTDPVVRAPATKALLFALASLRVEPEHPRSGYQRAHFPHWDDEDGDGCDTRCEILAAQRRPDGTWLSEWDGYETGDTAELHVDHVVALAEAWDSGADTWTAAQRDEFADYLPNLLAVSAASNERKGDKDAATWFPSRAAANCLWASTVVRVKGDWDLSVDQAEADALGNLLRTCEDYTPPTTTTQQTTTTRPPTTTTQRPPPPPPPPTTQPPSNSCTPGYSPCIPPGDDVDCAGGGGNGPRYVKGPVQVDHSYGDPYDLDRDGDGVGCEK